MMTPNMLQQWADLYKKNMPAKANNEFDPAAGDNYLGKALSFAQQMAGLQSQPQAGDFFGGNANPAAAGGYSPSAYVPPTRFQGMQPAMPDPQGLRPQINNYLARFLGK